MNDNPRFGKYTVLRRIGAGGMAEIFKCRLTGIGGFDKTVVVKRMLPDLREDPEFVKMFLDEARIAANLAHPNIVQIYDIDEIDNVPYIAMEYVRGPTLARLLFEGAKQKQASGLIAAKVLSDICAALHYAHNVSDPQGQPLNLIHRDVSPHNIIISTDGVPKLVDFGVAKARGRLSQTNAGTIKGKIRYMAPEQFRGASTSIDHRVDVFSTGVCLYQAATGRHAYAGQSEVEVLTAASAGTFPLPSSVMPGMDPELERIILWAMAPDLAERCPDAHALQAALEAFLSTGMQRVTTYHVKKHIRALFGDLDSSDVLGVGAYSGEAISSRRFASSQQSSSSAGAPDAAAAAAEGPASVSVELVEDAPKKGKRVLWAACVAGLCALSAGAYWHDRPAPAVASQSQSQDTTALALLDEALQQKKAGRMDMAQALLSRAHGLPELSPSTQMQLQALQDTLPPKTVVEEEEVADLPDSPGDTEPEVAGKSSPPPPSAPRRLEEGRLTLTAQPQATVVLDGRTVGSAPLRRRAVVAGTHRLELHQRGYESLERTIRVPAGKELKLTLQLTKKREDASRVSQTLADPPERISAKVASLTGPTATATDALPMGRDEDVPALPPPSNVAMAAQAPPAPAPVPEPVEPKGASVAVSAIQAPSEDGPIASCPEGATLKGAAPPRGLSLWCQTEDQVRHGKFIRWYANGVKAEAGEFRNGKKNGRWIEFYENGGERERTEWRRGVKSW